MRFFFKLVVAYFFWATLYIWNRLPDSVISANNVNTFKNRLDKFWANQELISDYKSSLTGTGNRSFVDSSDIIDF